MVGDQSELKLLKAERLIRQRWRFETRYLAVRFVAQAAVSCIGAAADSLNKLVTAKLFA